MTAETLTREQILALPPGLDLDDFVAEHVMGWRRAGGVAPEHKRFRAWLDKDGYVAAPPDWHPSTELDDAWAVLLHVLDRLYSTRRRFYDHLQLMPCRLGITGSVVAWPDVLTVLRHRFPEAVCKAALLTTLEAP